MCAGPRFEYHWQDPTSVHYKRPTKMSAPEYVDCLMNWIQAQLDDEAIFPSKIGKPLPCFAVTVTSYLTSLLPTRFRFPGQVYRSPRTLRQSSSRFCAVCSGCTHTFTTTTLHRSVR